MGRKIQKEPFEFKIGERVFAKLKGYPFWPSRIEQMPKKTDTGSKRKYKVMFYGTYEINWLKTVVILPYNEETIKSHGQARKSKSFNEAMYEIENDPELKSKRKRTSAATSFVATPAPSKSSAPKQQQKPAIESSVDATDATDDTSVFQSNASSNSGRDSSNVTEESVSSTATPSSVSTQLDATPPVVATRASTRRKQTQLEVDNDESSSSAAAAATATTDLTTANSKKRKSAVTASEDRTSSTNSLDSMVSTNSSSRAKSKQQRVNTQSVVDSKVASKSTNDDQGDATSECTEGSTTPQLTEEIDAATRDNAITDGAQRQRRSLRKTDLSVLIQDKKEKANHDAAAASTAVVTTARVLKTKLQDTNATNNEAGECAQSEACTSSKNKKREGKRSSVHASTSRLVGKSQHRSDDGTRSDERAAAAPTPPCDEKDASKSASSLCSDNESDSVTSSDYFNSLQIRSKRSKSKIIDDDTIDEEEASSVYPPAIADATAAAPHTIDKQSPSSIAGSRTPQSSSKNKQTPPATPSVVASQKKKLKPQAKLSEQRQVVQEKQTSSAVSGRKDSASSKSISDDKKSPATTVPPHHQEASQLTALSDKELKKLKLKDKRILSKKMLKIRNIRIQLALFRMEFEIKKSLRVDKTDVDRCCLIMQDLLQLPITQENLFKAAEVVETIKKCRKFKNSDKIKEVSNECFAKFCQILCMNGDETFQAEFESGRNKYISENLAKLKKERSLANKLVSEDARMRLLSEEHREQSFDADV